MLERQEDGRKMIEQWGWREDGGEMRNNKTSRTSASRTPQPGARAIDQSLWHLPTMKGNGGYDPWHHKNSRGGGRRITHYTVSGRRFPQRLQGQNSCLDQRLVSSALASLHRLGGPEGVTLFLRLLESL